MDQLLQNIQNAVDALKAAQASPVVNPNDSLVADLNAFLQAHGYSLPENEADKADVQEDAGEQIPVNVNQ